MPVVNVKLYKLKQAKLQTLAEVHCEDFHLKVGLNNIFASEIVPFRPNRHSDYTEPPV